MYTKNNKIYSDAGKILISDTIIGYSLNDTAVNVREVDIDFSDMVLADGLLKYSNGLIIQSYKPYNYGQWKAYIIKWRYTNDDQIAIMLNKNNSAADKLAFTRMQEWREWAGTLANKILNINTK